MKNKKPVRTLALTPKTIRVHHEAAMRALDERALRAVVGGAIQNGIDNNG